MKVIGGATCYWHSREDFACRVAGRWATSTDPLTSNPLYYLNPVYQGRFGLGAWHKRISHWFAPDEFLFACGTWSDPAHVHGLDFPVTVANGGADVTHPNSPSWAYVACAWAALAAHLCNRRDWDLFLLLEIDNLYGAVDWNAMLHEFMRRPEWVLGPGHAGQCCDGFAYKPQAMRRLLHERLRPDLTTDPNVMVFDVEIDILLRDHWWNLWPNVFTTRQDYRVDPNSARWNGEVVNWPLVRLPHPDIIPDFEARAKERGVPFRH